MTLDEKQEIAQELGNKLINMLSEYQEKLDSLPDAFEIFMQTFESILIFLISEGTSGDKQANIFIFMLGSLIKRFNYHQNTIPKGELQ